MTAHPVKPSALLTFGHSRADKTPVNTTVCSAATVSIFKNSVRFCNTQKPPFGFVSV